MGSLAKLADGFSAGPRGIDGRTSVGGSGLSRGNVTSHLFVLTLADAVGDGVAGAVAKADNTLDPGKVAVGLVSVGVGGEGIDGGAVGASGEDVASDAADVGLGDNEAVLAVGDGETEVLGLGGGPGLCVADGQRDTKGDLGNSGGEAGGDGDGVGQRVAAVDRDGDVVASSSDDGGDSNVPVEELLVGEDLDLGGLVAAAAGENVAEGGGGSDGKGGTALKSVVLGSLHDSVGAVLANNDDIVKVEGSGARSRGGDSSANEAGSGKNGETHLDGFW